MWDLELVQEDIDIILPNHEWVYKWFLGSSIYFGIPLSGMKYLPEDYINETVPIPDTNNPGSIITLPVMDDISESIWHTNDTPSLWIDPNTKYELFIYDNQGRYFIDHIPDRTDVTYHMTIHVKGIVPYIIDISICNILDSLSVYKHE